MGVAVTVAVAVAVGVGTGARPIPRSFTFCGLLAPSSVNFSKPSNSPFDGGMKLTETVQLPPCGKGVTHTKGFKLKPGPLAATLGSGKSVELLFVKVTERGLLVIPAGSWPKSIFFGATSNAGCFFAPVMDATAPPCACVVETALRIVASAIATATIAFDRWWKPRDSICSYTESLI